MKNVTINFSDGSYLEFTMSDEGYENFKNDIIFFTWINSNKYIATETLTNIIFNTDNITYFSEYDI